MPSILACCVSLEALANADSCFDTGMAYDVSADVKRRSNPGARRASCTSVLRFGCSDLGMFWISNPRPCAAHVPVLYVGAMYDFILNRVGFSGLGRCDLNRIGEVRV